MKEKTVMKKLMSMILALMMALSLVACGDKGGSGDNGDNGDSASKPEHTDTTTVAVGAVILARDDVAEDDVYKFVADIFDNAADLVTSHAKYGELEGLVNSLCSLEGVEQVQILLNGDYQMLLGTQPVSRPLLPTE